MKAPNIFENFESTIREVREHWPNVVIRFVDRHCSDVRSRDSKQRLSPKEMFAAFVSVDDLGVIYCDLPDFDFAAACTILALLFEDHFMGDQLAIYNHNLVHPNKETAYAAWVQANKKRLEK